MKKPKLHAGLTVERAAKARLFVCIKHGWEAIGHPCPECMKGDAPMRCFKHGWHATTGCPDCKAGK